MSDIDQVVEEAGTVPASPTRRWDDGAAAIAADPLISQCRCKEGGTVCGRLIPTPRKGKPYRCVPCLTGQHGPAKRHWYGE